MSTPPAFVTPAFLEYLKTRTVFDHVDPAEVERLLEAEEKLPRASNDEPFDPRDWWK